MLTDCLAGIKVLDLSQYIPGPLATRMLADLGARVLKIEPPQGDPMRTLPGQVGESGAGEAIAPAYRILNAGKAVVRLDLKSERDRARLERLLGRADVLMESYRPGTLDRLGFPRARLEAVNPRLVHCALSGFGQTGPHRLAAGHDITYLALTGGLSRTGPADLPLMPYPPLADHAGAMQATIAILAALLRRGATGKGAYLDVSLTESALGWMAGILTDGANPGQGPGREEALLNGGAAYYRVYRTGDGKFLALGAIEAKFWRSFCEAAGRPDLIVRQDEPFPQTCLIASLAELIAGRSLDEWMALLGPADCCAEPVLEPFEVPHHPMHRARGLVQDEGGLVSVLMPILMNGLAPSARRPVSEQAPDKVLEDWG
ncbi:MAG: CoA transferase [Rhodospirillales bacterium]|nr:CoA transferase [Rhodospirillales bacterium]